VATAEELSVFFLIVTLYNEQVEHSSKQCGMVIISHFNTTEITVIVGQAFR